MTQGPVRAADVPHDVTAEELHAVVDDALRLFEPSRYKRGYVWLSFAATCISVMRRRGWTVLPPGHHTPIDPR